METFLVFGGGDTLPKAQWTRWLSSAYKSNFFRSYHKFLHESWSNIVFRISSKHQFQNLSQTSAAKYWPNFSFKISPELQLQNLDQTLCLKSERSINFPTFCEVGWETDLQICYQRLRNFDSEVGNVPRQFQISHWDVDTKHQSTLTLTLCKIL